MMFRENSGAKSKIFYPGSIRAFSVSGNRFVCGEIRTDQLEREKKSNDQPPVLKTVFLLVLAEGNRIFTAMLMKAIKHIFLLKE